MGKGKRRNKWRLCELNESNIIEWETEKKEFSLFYVSDLLNVIYKTYQHKKPVYIHFICSRKNDIENIEKNNFIYYTPNSILEQYFPEHFRNVYFLCAHYTMWETKSVQNDTNSKIYMNNNWDGKYNYGNSSQLGKDTFYFIFTFYMEPNFIWEEINIPIFHDRGYIECKFDSVDNLMKLNNVVHLSNMVKTHAYNKTVVQYIRAWNKGGNAYKEYIGNNINVGKNNDYNTNKYDDIFGCRDKYISEQRNNRSVHLLPFFISSDYLHKNVKICKTRVVSFNERDIYCKIDPEENFSRQILLLIRKKLHKKLRSMEKNPPMVYVPRGELPRICIPTEDVPRICIPEEGTSSKDASPKEAPQTYISGEDTSRRDASPKEAPQTYISGEDTSRRDASPKEAPHTYISGEDTSRRDTPRVCVLGEDTLPKETPQTCVSGEDTPLKDTSLKDASLKDSSQKDAPRICMPGENSHLQNQPKKRQATQSEDAIFSKSGTKKVLKTENEDNFIGVNYKKIQQIINSTDTIFERKYSNEQLEKLLVQSKEKYGLKYVQSTTAHFTNDKVMNMHLELDEYYKFFQRNKNQFKNTLQDPWQLGLSRGRPRDTDKLN
ncbi:conserved Plasmodium protein, unknown function [Plasmodium ovale]|uniref:Uncharacterized protein n=2 Tax=Plasmodium ovale TaxID=36330 RepID=A0A1A8WBL8_PLAOA|nr:hypothetical protein POVCU2_0049380 [Plasmodium ovale curtisi]SBS98384.1 hypothetical protein POVCU1_045740 [Plasmodium ovale curtisi]SCQ17074.1 conserved Plasmodium protein, unknown function [Plasmodium ovale]